MTRNQKQALLDDVLFSVQNGEYEGRIVDDRNKGLSEWPEKYSGLVLHVSDHGNVSLYRMFRNGNTREIASRV